MGKRPKKTLIKYQSKKQFPEIPDGYDPKGSTRTILPELEMVEIDDVVIHIHKEHGFNGGSENIIMEAQMLLKGGYIKGNVCFVTKSDNVEKL